MEGKGINKGSRNTSVFVNLAANCGSPILSGLLIAFARGLVKTLMKTYKLFQDLRGSRPFLESFQHHSKKC